MSVPDRVYELVERFDQNREAYLRNYNETQVRGDFIDPLLEELGWDVHNRLGQPEAYRQVIEEDKLKIGGGTKAPDYGFYVGGHRKFYLEAKQPSVDIAGDVAPAVQLRRYAWTAQLPLSIVSDFEEFAFYDCRFEPQKTDKATTALLDLITYDKYADSWDQIASVFSYEAVRDGSLDKFAEANKRKRGTQTVDEAFLREIEGWREALARDLTSRNDLNRRQLNHAVQMTIDRIIFLRMAEDRGIEEYGRLLGITDTARVYEQLCNLFREADDRYNSGLFHFRREKGRSENLDSFTLGLKVDDALLRRIIGGLYYPESPYEFGVLPEDVLGQVYERFLGKVIRLENGGNRAVVEEKPEVRKAGGVYYTPTYIVDYIVEHTVGELLKKKTPEQVSKLKIVDPACGSGSFVLGAYKCLLDWHCNYYLKNGSKKYLKRLYQGAGGRWMLTIDEKKRILLNNIYAVDIDPQAVEVTKLSLLLKVLEGESEQTLEAQLKMFHERALPDLDNNIKSGNSLIGPDFYDNEQMMLLDEEEHYRINVFDWQSSFPQVFSGTKLGFDAVIGNPPYGIVFDEPTKPYLEQHYASFSRNNDNYAAFSQRAIELLAPNGLFGFIVPNTFLAGPYFDTLKREILDTTCVTQIIDFGLHQVFPKPNVFTGILLLRKKAHSEACAENSTEFVRVHDVASFPQSVKRLMLDQTTLDSLRWTPENSLMVRSFNGTVRLDEIAWVKDVGLNYWTKGRGKTRGGSIASRVLYTGDSEHPQDKLYLKGRDVSRYLAKPGKQWLRHNYREYLDPTVDTLRYSPEFLGREKIVYRQTADRIIATLEPKLLLTDKTLHTIVIRDGWEAKIDLRYLLGLLNSRLLTSLYRALAQEEGRTFAQVKTFRMKQLPIRTIDYSDTEDVARYERMIGLVERMLTLHRWLADAKIERERTIIGNQISATDRQIDRLVYELYGLAEDEINVVEGG